MYVMQYPIKKIGIGGQEDMKHIYGIIAAEGKVKAGKDVKVLSHT